MSKKNKKPNPEPIASLVAITEDNVSSKSVDVEVQAVNDLLEEIIAEGIELSHSKYIKEETVRYVVNEAKNAIADLIDLHFMKFDCGDNPLKYEIFLSEKRLPKPAKKDNLARGI